MCPLRAWVDREQLLSRHALRWCRPPSSKATTSSCTASRMQRRGVSRRPERSPSPVPRCGRQPFTCSPRTSRSLRWSPARLPD